MQVSMSESLVINNQEVNLNSIINRAQQNVASENHFEKTFSRLILGVANSSMLEFDKFYIMEMLNDQLDIELSCQEMMYETREE